LYSYSSVFFWLSNVFKILSKWEGEISLPLCFCNLREKDEA
jgi:hypothetical protein